MSHLLTLRPRDPLIARDGRPFGENAGSRMRSLSWPLPSMIAGSIRTLLGHAFGGRFDATLIQRLKEVACHGPLPASNGHLFLPAAHDALQAQGGACVTLRPEEISMLFTSVGLVLDDLVEPDAKAQPHHTELAVRVDPGNDQAFQQHLQSLHAYQSVGGERRVAAAEITDTVGQARFNCPSDVQQSLGQIQPGDGIRMVLATPAIFEHGWRPGWLNEDDGRVGTPPGLNRTVLKLRLVAVSNQRWDAVSGWSYELRRPKPIKRMVPAGGVYFLQVETVDSGCLSQLGSDLWLQPTSDDAQDRNDGFGLAVWGLWNKR